MNRKFKMGYKSVLNLPEEPEGKLSANFINTTVYVMIEHKLSFIKTSKVLKELF